MATQRRTMMSRWRDPFDLLISRYPGQCRVLAVVGLVLGTVAIGYEIHDIKRIPWELDGTSPTTVSTTAHCGEFAGAFYTITVDGHTYQCGGGDTKCGVRQQERVAYDRRSPSRCRLERNVDRPSLTQLSLLLGGLTGLSFAVSVMSWFRQIDRQPDLRGSGDRSLGYRIGRAALVISLALEVLVWCWSLVLYGVGV